MAIRKLVAGLLLGAAIVSYVYRPECMRSVFDQCAGCAVLYGGVLALSAWLFFTGNPVTTVDPAKKAVVITGCDSGFGHGLAISLDGLGYTVFAGCLAVEREGAMNLKARCSDRLHLIQLDVTDDWQVRGAVKVVKENLGDNVLWALVNNAGVAVFSEIEWCSVQQYQQIFDVNVLGVVRVTKAFLPLVRHAKGRIINVASLAGRFTVPAFSAYSMSKKACIAFSDALRQEMAKFNTKVITVEPGLYRTPITHETHLINANRKSWAETPTEVKEDYGEKYFEEFLNSITEHMKRARPQVNEVIDLMQEAVCSTNPKGRYVPYWLSNLRATILLYLPTVASDFILAKSYRKFQKTVPASIEE